MIVTYIRSSSYSGYDWCQHKYMLEFVLGMRSAAGLKAEKGNVVHKGLELLARRKLAQQEGLPSFRDEALDLEFTTGSMTPGLALDLGYRHYSDPSRTTHTWRPADRRDCGKWFADTLEFNGGMYSPLNVHVLQPEQYFDYEIREPWARYSYELAGGERLEGYLALKGTVDLVTRERAGVVHYIDWKTGERKNWKTGKPKSYADLRDDPQMRIYHHALSRLYPGEQIIITIFFCRSGGPFALCFDESDVPRTEEILRQRFEAIRNNLRPKLIYRPGLWKCERICEHFKKKWPGTDTSVCQFMSKELQTLGMDRLVEKYADVAKLSEYGSGGGRSSRKEDQ